MRRSLGLLIGFALLLASCGGNGGGGPGPGGGDGGQDLPAECPQTPFTMRLEADYEEALGGEEFTVQDAVARRVPILPGLEPTDDPDEIAAREEQAAQTDLALYTVYLSDAQIDRTAIEGFGFGLVEPEPGQLVASLSIVPSDEAGFEAGDVVDADGDFEYDPTTTLAELSLIVSTAEEPQPFQAIDETEGQVEVVALTEDAICLEVDVEMSYQGELVAAARGVVAAPVVRPPSSLYFT